MNGQKTVQRDHWRRIDVLLSECLDLPESERSSFLMNACADDDTSRFIVEDLLAREDRADEFMEEPIFSLGHKEESEPRIGTQVGPYRLVRELGRGGMGAVYLAERVDGEFEQEVAVKLLKRGMDTDEIVRRFRSERQILARLAHPNIARLLDGGTTEDGLPYFVMEYVAGVPISKFCELERFSINDTVALFLGACEGVEFAHRNLVVHRDLKPANIMVTPDGCPKLLDFGIAKLLYFDPELLMTMTSNPAPMTIEYASPEQLLGQPVTTATDVYTLGLVLYELLTGERPYQVNVASRRQLERAICEQVPPKPSTAIKAARNARLAKNGKVAQGRDITRLHRGLSGDLDNIIMKALRKDPERRFQSVEQFSEDLRRHLEGRPIRSRPDTFMYRTGKFIRRNVWGVATALVLVILLAGLAATMAAQFENTARKNIEIEHQRDRAERVTEFFVDFLQHSDPVRLRGQSLTVQEALDSAVAQLSTELQEDPEVRAEILDAVGGIYRNSAAYGKAKPLLAEALAIRRITTGSHPLVAESLHNLASLERDLGNDEHAETLMREAIEIQRATLPGVHVDLARGLNNLASLLLKNGELHEAEDLVNESLRIKTKIFGDLSAEAASSLNILASLLRKQGDTDRAIEHYNKAIEIYRAREGKPSPGLASGLNNLAALLADLGDLEPALRLHLESYNMRKQLHHSDHPRLVTSLNNLGLLHVYMGQYGEASRLLQEALGMQVRLYGTRSLNTAIIRKNLALAQCEAREFSRCEKSIRESILLLQNRGRSVQIAEARSILASCLVGQGQFQEAEPILLESYSVLKSELGVQSRRTLRSLEWIIAFYEKRGDLEAAAKYRSLHPASGVTGFRSG